MQQNALSVITTIKAGEVDALNTLLTEIGNDIQGNPHICFSRIGSLHFACWVILSDDPAFPPCLVLETNYDGDLSAHLDEWIANGGPGLDAVYSHCEGYPEPDKRSATLCKAYLMAHAVPSPAFYVGCPGQTVDSIHNAIAVREELEKFLDAEQAKGALEGLTPTQIHDRIKAHLMQPGIVKPIPSPRTLDEQKERAASNLVLLLLVGIPLAILLLPLLLVWTVILRIHEKRDAAQPKPPPLPVDKRLFEKEDIFVQNHLTTLVTVKPGAFRLATLKAVLWLVSLLAKTYFITGQLGGIPTIHFARWIMMNNDRRMLFFSNYDGSWASYLGDFVDKANYGLTAVWSNSERFPPSDYLFFGGARHIQEFKDWSREHNEFAAVWYSAYPDETLENLTNDIQLRDTVMKSLTEVEIERLLQRL